MKTQKIATAVILSSVLMVSACGQKDKASSEKNSETVTAIDIPSVADKDFDKLLTTSKRKVSEDEAQKALAVMGLDEKNEAISWASKSGKNGNYVYRDVTFKTDDDAAGTIETLRLTGVHMDGEYANFDRMDVAGAAFTEDNATVTIQSIVLARPAMSIASNMGNIAKNLSQMDTLGGVRFNLAKGDYSFGAALIKGVNIQSDQAKANLDMIAWGTNEKTQLARFKLSDLSIETVNADNPPAIIRLGSMSATGVNMAHYTAMNTLRSKDRSGIARSGLQGFNPLAKTFDSASFKNFDMNFDTLSIKSDGMQAIAKEKGDITTITSVMQPVTLTFTDAPTLPQLSAFQQNLTDLGYESLTVQARQISRLNTKTDTMTVDESIISLQDGFDMNYGYSFGGVNALTQALSSQSEKDTPDEAAIESALGAMSLSNFTLKVTDQSMLDRAFSLYAKKQGSSAALVKMQAKSLLMLGGLGARNDAEGRIMSELAKALGNFIDDGGTLEISLNPEKPLEMNTFQNLQDDQFDVEQLGFSVKVEP